MQNCVNIEENKDENDRILNELTEFTNTRVHSAELAVLQKKKRSSMVDHSDYLCWQPLCATIFTARVRAETSETQLCIR